jgi:hypothetical protein
MYKYTHRGEQRDGNVHHLSLLILRMMDAELLPDSEGSALLTQAEAARRSLEAGDREAAQRQIEQIALFIEELMRTDQLAQEEGETVFQTVTGILKPPPDADAPAC